MLQLIIPALALSLWAETPPAPKTKVAPVDEVFHGTHVPDPYRWLEDQGSPETRAWIAEQMGYTQKVLAGIPGRDKIYKELDPLLRTETMSMPLTRKGRHIYTRRLASESRASIYTRMGFSGREEKIVDPAALGSDTTLNVNPRMLSHDGKLLSFAVRRGGEDEVEIRFFDLETRKELADRLPRGRYMGLDLTHDKSDLYYVLQTSGGPRYFRHRMGQDPSSDKMFWGETLTTKNLGFLELSNDGRHVVISVNEGVPPEKTEIYVMDLKKGGQPQPVIRGYRAQFQGPMLDGKLYLVTNYKAPNSRLIAVDPLAPGEDKWREVIPESKWPLDVHYAGGCIFAETLRNAYSSVSMFDLTGKSLGEFPLPGIGTALFGPMGEWESAEAFYGFVSFAMPATLYRYDIKTGRQDLWFRPPTTVKAEDIEVKQLWYRSKDGTSVPMFVVARKGLTLDGNRPVYLTGYGGFNASMTPVFTPMGAFWIARGGVFAVPNLRGGGEFGEKWHEAGMFGNKQNVFDDFIGAAEFLIAQRYTKPKKIVIAGTSNGGLLVGAAMTQRPDLFGAVLCGFPLLDMLRYQHFKVARWWTSEYGSAEDAKQFEYIRKYSPYHKVEKGTAYPAVMLTSGDSDTRVDPLHARKMAALLQASNGSGRPILLQYDTASGHTPAGKPVEKRIQEMADMAGFALWQIGELE